MGSGREEPRAAGACVSRAAFRGLARGWSRRPGRGQRGRGGGPERDTLETEQVSPIPPSAGVALGPASFCAPGGGSLGPQSSWTLGLGYGGLLYGQSVRGRAGGQLAWKVTPLRPLNLLSDSARLGPEPLAPAWQCDFPLPSLLLWASVSPSVGLPTAASCWVHSLGYSAPVLRCSGRGPCRWCSSLGPRGSGEVLSGIRGSVSAPVCATPASDGVPRLVAHCQGLSPAVPVALISFSLLAP